MDLLLREATGQARGQRTFRDTVLSGDAITVGSAPDQQIQILGKSVHGEHAVLRASQGRLSVRCRRGATIAANGKRVRSATIGPGESFEIDGNSLAVIDAPAGFDLALELVPDPDVDASAYEAAFSTDLEQTWLSRRGPAWTLLALVLLIALGAPLIYLQVGDIDVERSGAGTAPDVLWTTGPLHPAHELAMGNDCTACHTDLFQRVQDEDCRVCHDALPDHVELDRAGELQLSHTRCATCHREHNEPELLVVRTDAQCTDCHADPEDFVRPLRVAAVSGFSAAHHPEFKATLLRPVVTEAGTGLSFAWRDQIESIDGGREQSNLVFPHDVHLDEVKVRNPNDSSAMSCGDCHTLSEDREHFRPIRMENHCASCHELTFDVTAPDRQLPHGEPREVAFAIEGYYARKFIDPGQSDDTSARRRRPDRASTAESCRESPSVCAERRTREEVSNQFSVRGCITCHAVSESEASDIYSRFQVHPVRLVADYFDSARFDHVSHLVQENKTGDAACLTCHRADTSSTSEDLLMPALDNCTQCHGDPSVPEVVTLQCVGCHEFHPPSFSPAPGATNVALGESPR
ncbi:MAG: hypothetical protein RIC56_13860 [Pseudomonadales bacterium]